MADEVRDILKKFPGIKSFEVLTFLGDRIGETLTGETAPGGGEHLRRDLDVLDAKAREVAAVLNSVPGHADVQVKAPARRAAHGRAPAAGPADAVRLPPGGGAGGDPDLLPGHRGRADAPRQPGRRRGRHPGREGRQDPEAIGSLLLRSPQGGVMPLRELAEIYPTSGRFSILHEGARRRQTVTCSTSGRDVTSFVEEAKKQVAAKVSFPAGAYAAFSGAAQAKEKAQRELLLHSAIAAVGILLLLIGRVPQRAEPAAGAGERALCAGRRRAGGLADHGSSARRAKAG